MFTLNKQPVWIEVEASAELRDTIGKSRAPAAAVVRAEELKGFAERGELFNNRNKKNQHAPLKEYLLGHSKTTAALRRSESLREPARY